MAVPVPATPQKLLKVLPLGQALPALLLPEATPQQPSTKQLIQIAAVKASIDFTAFSKR